MKDFAWHREFDRMCNHKQDNYEELSSLARLVIAAQRPFSEDAVKGLEQTFMAKVTKAHADRIGLRLPIDTLWFIVAASTSPGQAVMWVHFLRWLQSRLPDIALLPDTADLEVTLVDVYALVISKGLPSAVALDQLWEMQKVYGVNGLDMLTEADYVDRKNQD